MKVLISVDFEGISGIANANEIWARQAITDDTNAAIEGALVAGATQITVMDSHGLTKDNILWDQLHPRGSLIRGGPNTPTLFPRRPG
jgi:D-amino peptidase